MAGAMNDRLAVGDLDRMGIDTVIIAGTDIQGRMFGKRMTPRVFATKVDEGLHICTCVYAWDMAQSLDGLHVDFAGAHAGAREWADSCWAATAAAVSARHRPVPQREGLAATA
jgi:glutamine synthetase